MKFICNDLTIDKKTCSLTKVSAIGTVSDTLAKLNRFCQHFHALLLGCQLNVFLYFPFLILGLSNYLYCFVFFILIFFWEALA